MVQSLVENRGASEVAVAPETGELRRNKRAPDVDVAVAPEIGELQRKERRPIIFNWRNKGVRLFLSIYYGQPFDLGRFKHLVALLFTRTKLDYWLKVTLLLKKVKKSLKYPTKQALIREATYLSTEMGERLNIGVAYCFLMRSLQDELSVYILLKWSSDWQICLR